MFGFRSLAGLQYIAKTCKEVAGIYFTLDFNKVATLV